MALAVEHQPLAEVLADAGFIAAAEEADELLSCAAGDGALLDVLLERRLTGEPLAWITGRATFCGHTVCIDPGVYVPRHHSEQLAFRCVELLTSTATAIDLCTGSGAIAKTIAAAHPAARVIASDVDERAVSCARLNGIEVYCGDLFDPLPAGLEGKVDLVVGVVPYVPTPSLRLLARDTLVF
jgi:release factor glutamine methyltransferase